ncbi:uncharacterized protein BDZ99DRAFT_518515 [Mytilinidion resinicola]|uniref:NB-ARC domain-containing protein n=1 Tax=Mytilinidion resinicola TaxID=574789 RepID=A0A6A6YVB9_9PEZI|nr:uncharacterized protein BDZ99DRAFT_518515 [Mytilinidion resinicola]KAF2812700.1 hypothetical protein BDZ99DRAFT_518515 [Mytilinidion resinicola]
MQSFGRSRKDQPIFESFAEIARRLELPKGDENGPVQSTKNWLSKTTRSWLCIFDNVDDIRMSTEDHFLPWKGDIIITTRYKDQAKKVSDHSHSVPLEVSAKTTL